MLYLNKLQYNPLINIELSNSLSLNALEQNQEYEKLCLDYQTKYKHKMIKTFPFSKMGFLGLFLELDAKIAISRGESEAVVEAGLLYEKLGFKLIWLELNRDGSVDLSKLVDAEFIFISSYVMDTFVKTDIKGIKKITDAKIISNASAHFDENSDAIYFDSYKLTGFALSGVLLFGDEIFELTSIGFMDTIALKLCFDGLKMQSFNFELKAKFLKELKKSFKEDIYFFVSPTSTLEYSLHFGLKHIKAREFIRTLALCKIFITNGEGCSLGLAKPSRVIRAMGYSDEQSRNSIEFSFMNEISDERIESIVKTMRLKYTQLISFND
ncbi:hypothetical protein M947_09250 [Sulfurimonas hongkongensis]|uniref:Cysteine desulfurase n=1 Tax=Sulfurimonas hongkongensis TaxID=1172190 RepID=T0KFC8_9BACT|nr:hypothetical protein [Sulfurimonas hongkongensis]EQB35459.1 hypothetical protein M947_09250 [Sulfurimonas hongkongensis]